MHTRTKKILANGLRITIGVVALWLVIRGVSLRDRVELRDGGRSVVGSITAAAGEVMVRSSGGAEVFSLSEVAVDEHGAPQISYGLISQWHASQKRYLLAAVVVFGMVPFFQAKRIRDLLRVQRIDISFAHSLRISFAGNFLNFAAPLGSTAGDVFKAYYFSLHTSRKTEAMTIVFLDRLIGLVTLLLVVALITIFSYGDTRLAPLRSYMLAMLLLSLVAGVAYLSPAVRRLSICRRLASRLPMREQLRRIDHTTRDLVRQWKILAGAVGTTVVLQVVAAWSFLLVAIATGMTAGADHALEYFAYFSTGELIKALPGPPQGLGTMELAYGYLFSPFGDMSRILCAAFAIRVVMLLCSLPGAAVALTGSYKPSRALDRVNAPALQAE
jgi:uncharacterized protein (TIRG00374 family)